MTYFLAGAALGIAGSVHCAGMCGPLLLAVHRGTSRAQRIRRIAAYHAARVTMYALLGIPAGYAGHALSYSAFGRGTAMLAGILVLATATGPVASRYSQSIGRAWSTGLVKIGARAAIVIRRHPNCGYLVLGAANGLLPCGLVYAAAAAAAASGTVPRAVAFMIGFGAATAPLLFAVTLSAATVPRRVRDQLRFVAPVLMGLAGMLLIVRALIPVDGVGHHHQARERRTAEITERHNHGTTAVTEVPFSKGQ